MDCLEARVPDDRQQAAATAAGLFPVEHRMEHRWGTRRVCRAPVSVSAGGGLGGTGRLRNISISGAFLETALPLQSYTQVSLAVLKEDGSAHAIEFPAVVVRHEAGGVGLEWCDPNPGQICRKLGCRVECAFAEG